METTIHMGNIQKSRLPSWKGTCRNPKTPKVDRAPIASALEQAKKKKK